MNAVAESLHSRPKYVASTTLTETRWANTTVLSSEVAAAVDGLRAEPGGELLVPGSGALIRWLLANDLVDQMNLLIFPVSSGRERDCSPTRARTGRSSWSDRGPLPAA